MVTRNDVDHSNSSHQDPSHPNLTGKAAELKSIGLLRKLRHQDLTQIKVTNEVKKKTIRKGDMWEEETQKKGKGSSPIHCEQECFLWTCLNT